jgi:deoxyribodipyrimidine photo-lyase
MDAKPTIVWFRNDFRLEDNRALSQAVLRGAPVIPVYIYAPNEEGDWPLGAASRWWLHHSLAALDDDLRRRKSRLVIRRGPALEALRSLITETGAVAAFWNRRYEPAISIRDRRIQQGLESAGVLVQTFNSSLLFEPDELRTGRGSPFQVFTPFWKTCLSKPSTEPVVDAPRQFVSPLSWPASLPLDSLGLCSRIDWASGIRATWLPGEAGAAQALVSFCLNHLLSYEATRDKPASVGTSRLSPFLNFGEIGPRQVWQRVNAVRARTEDKSIWHSADAHLRQLGWREFAHHLLYHFPHTPLEPLRPRFKHFPWSSDAGALKAWQQGLTGYPIVDAGMRELWTTGWMHNRVRMIAASFLVKHLLIPWQEGARWFWDTLVDADLANNTLGWQWVAGCGADAAPYFRIFNPTLQSTRFDSEGKYIKRWVPELANLPSRWVHDPSGAPPLTLSAAGVKLGENYPAPIVAHSFARQRALAAYEIVRKGK